MLQPGRLVRSKAGRDRAKLFLVLEILDAKHVSVVDGHTHPLSRPKKKRVIHLQPYKAAVDGFADSMAAGKLNDADIRKILKPYEPAEEESWYGRQRRH